VRSSKPASSIMSNLKYKKKYWIEWQNQKEKSNSQKNPNHKKNKENQFSTNLMIMDEIF
jgi:hypothetical protein